jgi:phosphoserine phosphatase
LKLICFDCDSTLSSIEGIDELARIHGPEVFARVEAMTRDAMNGRIRLEEVFGRRLDIIRPGAADAAAIGGRYLANVEPTAKATIAVLVERGWTPVIVSGGFRQAIRPLADFLGVARVEAVDLHFGPDGAYSGYDAAYPTTRTGGKLEVIRALRSELRPAMVVMVGDGVSDLETRPEVELFVGYGGFTARDRVEREAAVFVRSLEAILPLV